MQTLDQPTTTTAEPVEVNGGFQIMETIKKLVHEGNVRKIIVKQDGHTIAEFPLTFGVVGAAIAPALAAIGAIAALVTECSIEVERTPEGEPTSP
jgi:uncharacterized protein DUF4342